MDEPNKKELDLFGFLKAWIPWRSKSADVSRDFWMPDHSCRVCYDCDAQFTVFNRRHHCRLCGRIFCGKCTANSVPAHSADSSNLLGEWERVRVCNYCFKQWEQGVARVGHGPQEVIDRSLAPVSDESDDSSKSSESAYGSTVTICSMSFGFCEQISESLSHSPYQSAMTDAPVDSQSTEESRSYGTVPYADDSSINQCASGTNRSDDEDVFGVYDLDSKAKSSSQANGFYAPIEINLMQNVYDSFNHEPTMGDVDTKSLSSSAFQESYDVHDDGEHLRVRKKEENDFGDECEAPSSLCAVEDVNSEPVDFENNGLLWLPPEPENEEDERDASLFDGDDADATEEWSHMRNSSSFSSSEYHEKEKSGEDQKKAVKNVVDEHFRALLSQLLQVENIPVTDDNVTESWLEIITALSWEAATLLKPDTSRSGGMDPGGYVKVKCIASGRRSESMVVKGVVCKKNVAHRRMTPRIERPRLMILGGALEYQRVSNLLSSFDTLLQQETDHLKMAVAKIDAHRPNVLLVEKSVSRYAQEYILAKDISLALNIKRPLLERIARCTGAQIVPSIDHLSAQKMGYCDLFHVDKCFEGHGSAGQSGKKLTKTLMYFEGCPRPLGFTILLRGANGDELKKVKHVVQYGVFAAYHLALETSFLADEGASLPEHLFNEPITVALPNKSLSIDRSISMVPGFTVPAQGKQENFGQPQIVDAMTTAILSGTNMENTELTKSLSLPLNIIPNTGPSLTCCGVTSFSTKLSGNLFGSEPFLDDVASKSAADKEKHVVEFVDQNTSGETCGELLNAQLEEDDSEIPESREHASIAEGGQYANNRTGLNETIASEAMSRQQDTKSIVPDETGSSKEEFSLSPSEAQSILVSLSSRCVWKGTVCERSHLFRIKYYGNFDKPLGRFLQDHLFDQSYRCRQCDLPSDAHVHCYTHWQGTLTISVKKLPEILLPGERDKKIWMWHRCLRCPRTNGFPPATRRVVMSDAAWGLSFGKFLELSFSNHAAASRVASCGHSLHRDCLRFYGCGKMVACFRYASIDVYSVYLPPAKVDFNYELQDWIQKEADEVAERAKLLFSEVCNAIRQIAEKRCRGHDAGLKSTDTKLAALEGLLENEKTEFEEMYQKSSHREEKTKHSAHDILEINRLRKQLLFQSYFWDHRLVIAAKDDIQIEDKDVPNGDFLGITNFSRSNNSVTPGEALSPEQKFVRSNLDVGTKGAAYPLEKAFLTGGSPDLTSDYEELGDPSCAENYKRVDPLESGSTVRRALSDSQFINLSDTLDAAWTGKTQPGSGISKDNNFSLTGSTSVDSSLAVVAERLALENRAEEKGVAKTNSSSSPVATSNPKGSDTAEDSLSWLGMPFFNFYRSFNKNFLGSVQKLDRFGGYKSTYISTAQELGLQSGAKWLMPEGPNEIVIPVYDDEPTSIISYALISQDYLSQLSDDGERLKDLESASSLPLQESASFHQFLPLDDPSNESNRSLSIDDSFLSAQGTRSSFMSDPLADTKSLHIRVSFTVNGPVDKVKYTVTCFYAKHFDALRKICCSSEVDFVRSLSRCKNWGAQGGKSNVFFAKTLDDRFIVKQVTKTELESFIKFAPEYFKYLMESINTKSPTCLAKILGIYQVTIKNLKGGKESKLDVLVMENLLFRRTVTRLYDLKGSLRSRYNPDSNGNNKVLLDQNLIEAMPTSPIFVGNKAKRLLERAVWNDTAFLASVDVMDYSLLVGVDKDKHELVLGIIDFMRQYTWDKHLETWVKTSMILGGPKNESPTVISPKQYKKRFRKAMTTYFLMVPDNWSPPTIVPSKSQSNLCEDQSGS